CSYTRLRGLFMLLYLSFFFFSSRRRHTRFSRDWSSDVCSSDLGLTLLAVLVFHDVAQVAQVDRGSLADSLQDQFTLDTVKAGTRSEERRVGKECRSK